MKTCSELAKNGLCCVRPAKHAGQHGNKICSCGREPREVFQGKIRSTCRLCHNAATNSWRREHGWIYRPVYTRHRLTPEMVHYLIQKQTSKCALCSALLGSRYCIDHSHTCPNYKPKFGCPECVRGLLCRPCNSVRLPWAESLPNEAWPEFITSYLQSRPLLSSGRAFQGFR